MGILASSRTIVWDYKIDDLILSPHHTTPYKHLTFLIPFIRSYLHTMKDIIRDNKSPVCKLFFLLHKYLLCTFLSYLVAYFNMIFVLNAFSVYSFLYLNMLKLLTHTFSFYQQQQQEKYFSSFIRLRKRKEKKIK